MWPSWDVAAQPPPRPPQRGFGGYGRRARVGTSRSGRAAVFWAAASWEVASWAGASWAASWAGASWAASRAAGMAAFGAGTRGGMARMRLSSRAGGRLGWLAPIGTTRRPRADCTEAGAQRQTLRLCASRLASWRATGPRAWAVVAAHHHRPPTWGRALPPRTAGAIPRSRLPASPTQEGSDCTCRAQSATLPV